MRVPSAASREVLHRKGMVLLTVIFFYLLLMGFVSTFLRRAVLDVNIVTNRDAAAQAEALARGGVQLATALLLEDRVLEGQERFDSPHDVWARVGTTQINTEDGGVLTLRIEDAAARINLNSLLDSNGDPITDAEPFLTAWLTKIVEEIPGRPEEKLYDAAELARSLLDYLDQDQERQRGGLEDEYYQQQDPPYRAANRVLLSVEELGLVEGFDGALVEGMRPYATVYPFVGTRGVNVNTAPAWVLASLYHGTGSDLELADEDRVRSFLVNRQRDTFYCPDGMADFPTGSCAPTDPFPGETVIPGTRLDSDIFLVRAEAVVRQVRRTVETVIDRSDVTAPQLLAWRVE